MYICISIFNHLCLYKAKYDFMSMSNFHSSQYGSFRILPLLICNLPAQTGRSFAQNVLSNLSGASLSLDECQPICTFKWTLELCSNDWAWTTMLISQKHWLGRHCQEPLRPQGPTASSLLTIRLVGSSVWSIKHTRTHTPLQVSRWRLKNIVMWEQHAK